MLLVVVGAASWIQPTPLHVRPTRYSGLRMSPVVDEEVSLLRLAAITDRGQRASVLERDQAARLVRALEESAPDADATMLNGRWRLAYTSENAVYRSSPFFWAFRQTAKELKTPVAVGESVRAGDAFAEAVYAITDAIPFYDIGSVTQTISGVCDPDAGCAVDEDDPDDPNGPTDGATFRSEPSDGTSSGPLDTDAALVSEVVLTIGRNFGLPAMSSVMTTTASLSSIPAADGGAAAGAQPLDQRVVVQTTSVKQSTLSALLPAFGEPIFPSGDAMELAAPGSSTLTLRTTCACRFLPRGHPLCPPDVRPPCDRRATAVRPPGVAARQVPHRLDADLARGAAALRGRLRWRIALRLCSRVLTACRRRPRVGLVRDS